MNECMGIVKFCIFRVFCKSHEYTSNSIRNCISESINTFKMDEKIYIFLNFCRRENIYIFIFPTFIVELSVLFFEEIIFRQAFYLVKCFLIELFFQASYLLHILKLLNFHSTILSFPQMIFHSRLYRIIYYQQWISFSFYSQVDHHLLILIEVVYHHYLYNSLLVSVLVLGIITILSPNLAYRRLWIQNWIISMLQPYLSLDQHSLIPNILLCHQQFLVRAQCMIHKADLHNVWILQQQFLFHAVRQDC